MKASNHMISFEKKNKKKQYFPEKIISSENFIFPLWSIYQSPILTKSKMQSLKVFYKKRCSWKLRNIHGKTPMLESPFNKVAEFLICSFIKKDSNTVFSCEYCEIFKKNLCKKHANGCFWKCDSSVLKL